ncbi:MAG: ParB/RepB/Spo0J family partition protein [Comamonadaceae bacterium]|nr:MAG: ParB/RepB/Spo0J family partition protein [Comamonadaceae bacterium]
MANKDLVKRAFSVTANLPVTSGSPSGTTPDTVTAVDQAMPTSSVPEARFPAPAQDAMKSGGPKTGPGSMLAFMTEQSTVHQEVVRLRHQLDEFQDAAATRKLDPKKVLPSNWANRDESHFATEPFSRLKREIESAGGNIQPIKVRAVAPDAGGNARWEIVYGHRRHRACLELGLPVLAMIEPAMKDADLFVEMERENRERADLSAWEQGVMYMRALEMGLFPSAKQLAAAIDRDMGNISKAMALAKLPTDVVRAFGSPLNLQFRWATALKDAHQRDPEKLIATAVELRERRPAPAPAEVFATLTSTGTSPPSSKGTETVWKDDKGTKVAVLSLDRKGRATLAFDLPMDEGQVRKLSKLVDGFLAKKA